MTSSVTSPEDQIADIIYDYYYDQLSGTLGDQLLFNDGFRLFEQLGAKYTEAVEQDLPKLLESGPVQFVGRQLLGGSDYQRLKNLAHSLERVKRAIDSIIRQLAPQVGQVSDDEIIKQYEQLMVRSIPKADALRMIDDVAHGLLVINQWFHPTNVLAKGRRKLIESLLSQAMHGESAEAKRLKDRLLMTVRRDKEALPELARRFRVAEEHYLNDLYVRQGDDPGDAAAPATAADPPAGPSVPD